jgi:aspartate/methionine/tyrosine aminotransferase
LNPAERIRGIQPSPIRLISEGAPKDAIPLGLGEPGWDVPEPARRALAEIEGPLGYGPNAGLPELRDAVASFHGVRREEVLITAGSQGALFSLFSGFVNPGDEVLVPDPGFPAYATLARICGATAVTYPLAATDHFRLRAAPIALLIASRPKVRAVVLNHPANPTGAGADPDELRAIADACEKRDVLLVSDEVYRDLYLGARGPTLRDVTKFGVVVSSVSKGFGSPGLRVGWAIGDPAWIDPPRTVHNHAVTSAAITSQIAAIALLRNAATVLPAARDEVRSRFEAIALACRTHLGAEIAPPDGAFYLWLRLPERALADPIAFAIDLRDHAKVVITPGVVFGEAGRPYARISFAARPEVVAEGIKRLAPRWKT